MPLSQITVGSVNFRAFDLGSGTLWLPVHMLADSTGALIDKSNALPVGGGHPVVMTTTIANGQSLSPVVDLGRTVLGGIILPASGSWDAANITFQASADGTSLFDLYDGTTERVLTTSGVLGKAVALDTSTWLAWRYIKLRSGTAGTPVNQTAARTITIVSVQ
jgi:hypothetical protein